MDTKTGARQVKINQREAKRQQYVSADCVNRAAARALRWLKSRRNLGARPPRHIKEKMALLQLT